MPSRSTFVGNLKGWQLWTEFKAFRFVAAFKQPLWKGFWVAVILGTFAAFVIQSIFVLTDFFHYKVDTVVQLKSVKGIPFPAVTICNLNPIRKSAMDYVEELSDLVRYEERL
ncbi:hypothetical protein AAVH_14403 [Aphelenchoides avenae]|nr:hypothetical protein AAVH_14403 [Aphelenchus avenae]